MRIFTIPKEQQSECSSDPAEGATTTDVSAYKAVCQNP